MNTIHVMKLRFRFAALLLLPALPALAWYEKTHSWLFSQAVEMVRQKDRDQGLYEELYSDAFRLQMGRGAWREDFNAPVDGNSRAMRHYYDPVSGHGIPYYPYFDAWPYVDPNEKVSPPPKGLYDGALRWALDGGAIAGNPYHWEGAIDAHGYGSPSARREAYYRLGHALHLLGDMSEVDHSTNTVHPGSGKYMPDTLEDALTDLTMKVLESLMQAGFLGTADTEAIRAFLRPQGEMVARNIIHERLKELLKRPAAPGPVRLTGYEGIVEDSVDPRLVVDFFFGPEPGGLRPAVDGLPPPPSGGGAPPGHREVQVYFNELAAFAKRSLPSGMTPAVGCEDLRPVVLGLVSGLFWQSPDILKAAAQHRYLSSPIYGIPTINEYDPNSFLPYLRYRDAMLGETVAYLAGLMMHFHDIVREPPYVQEVSVRQSKDRYYWGAWGEGANNAPDVPTFRSVEKYYGVTVPSDLTPKSFKAIRSRTLVQKTDRTLLAGQTAEVRIVFGPVLQVGSGANDQIKHRIDPASVRVRVDRKAIAGALEAPNTWVGVYTPELGPGQAEKTVEVWIEARDRYAHHLAVEPNRSGYPLDTDPASVSRVVVQMPDFKAPDAHIKPPSYEWRFYEGGLKHDFIDRNHRFTISREAAEEAANGPQCSLAPSRTVVAISGRLNSEELEQERRRWKGQLDVAAPVVRFVLRDDGAATITPAAEDRIEVRWEHRAGQPGGWREVWVAQVRPGRGTILRASGPCLVGRERYEWTAAANGIQMRTDRTQPQNTEWTALYDKGGIYQLHLGASWGPPRFKLQEADPPDAPDVLVAQYLAWFAQGSRDTFNHGELERVERELNARGLRPLTAVASLCAAKKSVFLRDNPAPGDSELAYRLTALALYHLKAEGPMHADRGEYILQAIAASKMNQWGDKGHLPGWDDKPLERGVKAAPGFFPDTNEPGLGYAGGVELFGTGRSRVAALKEKYKNFRPAPLFEGW
jgi:hypothetical protein